MSYEFQSTLNISDKVTFKLLHKDYRDIESHLVMGEYISEGEIVAIKFTNSGVFYNCLSYYYGTVFNDICLDKVSLTEEK